MVYNSETAVEPETDTYTTLANVLKEKVKAQNTGKVVVSDRITEPMPLTVSGTLYYNAINDPENYPYLTRTFREYKSFDFSLLPLSK